MAKNKTLKEIYAELTEDTNKKGTSGRKFLNVRTPNTHFCFQKLEFVGGSFDNDFHAEEILETGEVQDVIFSAPTALKTRLKNLMELYKNQNFAVLVRYNGTKKAEKTGREMHAFFVKEVMVEEKEEEELMAAYLKKTKKTKAQAEKDIQATIDEMSGLLDNVGALHILLSKPN